MSCYFRHLKEIFREANIEVTAENRKQIDQAIHSMFGVSYKECPVTWKALKREVLLDEPKRQAFIARLREAIR
ncbi:MAG: hypothetical protein HY670_11975 [Chloroflexi bacterium]|nr:hypothetical protein [Chloroflexota bacterium]